MSKSAKDRLAALERHQEEVIELEDLSEYYKDIFGEDVEPQPPDESRDKK